MSIDKTHHCQLLLDSLLVQFDAEEFADCILAAEGKSVKVHKAVLCCNSVFLQKIVSDHNDPDLTLVIDGIRFDDLYLVIQFLYKGDIVVSSDQVGSFLVVAELLGMKWIGDVSLSYQEASKCGKLALPTLPSQLSLPFKNITNALIGKVRKRKKNESNKKASKKLKMKQQGAEVIFERDNQPSVMNHPETDLAQMDEKTFCTALGLKKNGVRGAVKCGNTSSSIKSVPPCRIGADVKLKFSNNVKVSETASSLCETTPVYIEEKNLTLLNIDANELYIRENNIEIECDVLDVTTHELFDKENNNTTTSILRMNEGNLAARLIINAGDAVPESNVNCNRKTDKKNEKCVYGQEPRQVDILSARHDKEGSSTYAGKLSGVACGEGKDEVRAISGSGGGGDGGGDSGDGNVSESTIFWCDVCQRTYHTKTGLNQHKRYECCKDPAFACPRCEKRFKRKSSLVRHAITLHNEAVYPTRTKLLSKLTSPRTIAGKR